jgi:hypothetical protein
VPSLLTPQQRVIVLYGFGIIINVDRGHLFVRDGIGEVRREGRFPRVGHSIRRLVLIGSDGIVSLSALRWLSSQDVAFVMFERNGKILATTCAIAWSERFQPEPKES